MPIGGVCVVSTAVPKNPTSRAFAEIVVIDGATMEADAAFIWPPWAPTGFAGSTPLYATMPPAADDDFDRPKVYGPGSDPAMWTNTVWRMVFPLKSARTWVQPAGALTVAFPRREIAASERVAGDDTAGLGQDEGGRGRVVGA